MAVGPVLLFWSNLAWYNSGMAFQRRSYSASEVAIYLAGLGQGFPGSWSYSELASIFGSVSPTAGIYRSKNQGIEIGVALLTISPSDLLVTFLLPVSPILCSAGLEVLVQREEFFHQETPQWFHWARNYSSSGRSVTLDQHTKKGRSVLAGMIDPGSP